MTTQNRFRTVLTIAGVAMAMLTASANAEITFDGFQSWQPTSALGTFDASGSDKLVVVVTGEHNFNQSAGGQIHDITYDGQSLTKAVDVDPNKISEGGHGDTATDIWYLDNPRAVHTSGALAASVSGNGNNYVYTAIGLSGAADGVGATATAPGAASVDLTTTAGSMVIFNIGMGGGGNTASPLPGVTATSPAAAVMIDGLEAGSNWAGHAVAYAAISSPGLQTFSFDTIKTDVATIAAAFEDAFVDANIPSVDAGRDVITWSGEPVTLDPNVVVKQGSGWTDLTYAWSAEPSEGVEFSDPDALAPAVTITKTTDNPSVVTLTLGVNKEGRTEPPVTDAMTVELYDDSCLAAKAVGSLELDPTDIDGNCITVFGDFALMAVAWLDDYALTEPVAK